MYEQIKKLSHKFWLTSDNKLSIFFQEIKGMNMVKVTELNNQKTECMYLLLPTLESEVFAFDTPNGRFSIGIASSGEELFLSPLGIFLFPFGQTGCETQNILVYSSDESGINNAYSGLINQ